MSHTSPQTLTAHWLKAQSHILIQPPKKNLPATDFYGFIDHFPDSPDSVVSVSGNGIAREDGRIMTGEVISHPGVQIRVRALENTVAYNKAMSLFVVFSDARRVTMLATDFPEVLTSDYYIANFSPQGSPRFVGVGKDDQRPSFVFDLYLTFRKLT